MLSQGHGGPHRVEGNGGPVRLCVALMYFYKSAEWLSGISVTDKVVPGY
ncbi:molybdopterin-dependent oxidoreductase [Streptosporangium sp. NPDC000396]